MRGRAVGAPKQSMGAAGLALLLLGLSVGGCARLPYTTYVVQKDPRVAVMIQHEVNPANYTHPIELSLDELGGILNGFSVREKKRLPLRWFAEETPPQKIFRLDELQVLVPPLREALEKAGPDERVYFQLLAPGPNPAYDRDVTAGWIAVRDPYFYLALDYFHTKLPVRKFDRYDYNFPLVPEAPHAYLLYFEPGRFWVSEPTSGRHAADFRGFLRSGSAPIGR